MSATRNSTDDNIRTLRDDEIAAISGGVTEGGCIRYPTVLFPWLPFPIPPFVDVFKHPTIG
jgi:hypothetical protein